MPSKPKSKSSSSSHFTLSKSGYANLTAVALTSSLYLLSLHRRLRTIRMRRMGCILLLMRMYMMLPAS
ncbi:hypothetical protein CJF31_00004943 [Rutstroemia sp. NJR-2017a BVV2]|nr:hypothetical protein CJF31_00004943 [Rutstroemia sp. NJR-2017a BVV2]